MKAKQDPKSPIKITMDTSGFVRPEVVSTEGMRPYQLSKIKEMKNDRVKSLLILRYGTGKTWTVIALANYLHLSRTGSQFTIAAVILCRNRNVETWRTELLKRNPEANVRVITDRQWAPLNCNSYVLVPHHLIEKYMGLLEKIIEICKPPTMICDESTKIKNCKTQRTQNALTLAAFHRAYVKDSRQICMTGKATPEGPHEIWSQMAFSGTTGKIGATYYQMLNRFFLITDRGPILKAELRGTFFDACKHAISRMSLEEWAEYRKENKLIVNQQIEYFEESKEQLYLIKGLEDRWEIENDNEITEYIYSIQIHAKAQQIANGFFRVGDESVILKDQPKAKLLIETLDELFAEDSNRSILIWCHYHEDYSIVGNALKEAKIDYVIGPDALSIKAFENKHTQVLLMPISISEGWNELAVADTDIFYSNIYSIETREQAEARLDRPMIQKSPIITHIDLCGGRSYDRRIVEALQMKRPINKQGIR